MKQTQGLRNSSRARGGDGTQTSLHVSLPSSIWANPNKQLRALQSKGSFKVMHVAMVEEAPTELLGKSGTSGSISS